MAKKRGRPRIAAEDQKRHTVGVQMTDSLKRNMEVMAEYERCSLSRAVELAVERYFASSLRYGELYRSQMFGRLMAAAFTMGGEKACIAKYYGRDSDSVTVGLMMSFDAPGQEWANDPYCYRKAAEEVMRALARYRPRGEIEGPDDHLVSESEREEWFGSLLAFFERQSEWRPDIPTILTAGAAEALKIARRVDLEDRARRLRRDAERLQRITDLDLPVYMGADLDHWVAFLEGLQSRGQVFFQTIPDDALASIGFTKGDMVVFQQVDAPPPDGEIVAALVDRREAVFGVYRRDGGDVLLETTRPGDKPRRLEAERVAVVGRLWGRADEFAQRLQTILERNTRAPQATGSKSNAAVDHASADPNSKQGSEKNRKLAPARNRSIKGITKPKKGPA